MIGSSVVDAIGAELAAVGLNRCRLVAVEMLPSDIALPGSAWPPASTSTLLVVGHAGTSLWSHLTGGKQGRTLDAAGDPIDTFSIETSQAALAGHLPGVARRLLYPHPGCPVDLVALGRVIGWQTPSPLGLGIHPEWGLWSAFRALWLLSAGIEEDEPDAASDLAAVADVCATCPTHDCVRACPAHAVAIGRRFDIGACFDHRAEPASSCAETCHARRACPVGPTHRYSEAQMSYHYQLSRPAVRGRGRERDEAEPDPAR